MEPMAQKAAAAIETADATGALSPSNPIPSDLDEGNLEPEADFQGVPRVQNVQNGVLNGATLHILDDKVANSNALDQLGPENHGDGADTIYPHPTNATPNPETTPAE